MSTNEEVEIPELSMILGTIYLCGPITGETFWQAKHGWRKDVYEQLTPLGITCLSPLRHLKAQQLREVDLDSMSPQGSEVGVLSTPKGLTARDKFDVKRSDIIFCNLIGATSGSLGSMIEFGWGDAWDIPILICMEENGNPHDHAMIDAICSWRVPTLEAGVETIKDLLLIGV